MAFTPTNEAVSAPSKVELGDAQFRGLLRTAIVVPFLIGLAVTALLFWQIENVVSTARWVDHTDQVLGASYELQKQMFDAESGVRGYYASGEKVLLEPYELAKADVPRAISVLRDLTKDNQRQQEILSRVGPAWDDWIRWEKNLVARLERGEDVRPLYRSLEGKKRMDVIRGILVDFRKHEAELRDSRQRQLNSAHRSFLGAIAVLFLALAAIVPMLARQAFRRLAGAYSGTITELERTAQQLFESREWFSTSLSSIGDAVIAVDLGERVTFLNSVAEKLTGWTLAEAAGRPMPEVFVIVNQETRKPAADPVKRVLRDGVVVGLANHTQLIARGGQERPIEDSAAPIRGRDGRMHGVILVFRDVSEKYHQQEHLKHLNEELREAIRHRDDFLSLASHELKTPLTALKLKLQISERRLDRDGGGPMPPDALRKLLDTFSEQVHRLTKLVDDLLDVSRIRVQKMGYQFEEVDFSSLIRTQCERMHDEFRASGSVLDCAIEDGVRLHADPIRIEQVLNNLLSNALKYGSGKPVRVSVRRENTCAVLEVCDEGIGIPADKQAAIFDRFERAVSGTHISGLGLGLYIAREIVDAHGGSILVESELGAGSKFTVKLPLG